MAEPLTTPSAPAAGSRQPGAAAPVPPAHLGRLLQALQRAGVPIGPRGARAAALPACSTR